MSNRYKGGIISATPPTTTGGNDGVASGAWTLEQQMQAQAAGLWPNQPIFYIEDVFSTYLWAGNSGAQTITNNINLSGKGGLVWVKNRTGVANNTLQDTVRGVDKNIYSNAADAQTSGGQLTSFTTTGFTISGSGTEYNASGSNYVSWTFREQPKFFDVVTYTGNGTSGRTVAHNLGSVPGCIIVKRTSGDPIEWAVYHRSLDATSPQNYYLRLNTTAARALQSGNWNDTAPTSTVFTLGDSGAVNTNGETYVAYVFAHDAGGFGLTGTDNVITCGSFTTDGSGNATVNLGYEPQWVLMKPSTTATSGNWIIADNMRGWTIDGAGGNANQQLYANSSSAESGGTPANLTSTGFNFTSSYGPWASQTWIYIAIRRGPMKVPTVGTNVFKVETYNQTSAADPAFNLGKVADMGFRRLNDFESNWTLQSRLTGNNGLITNTTAAESNQPLGFWDNNVGWYQGNAITPPYSQANWYGWTFARAPSFFDEVCYTGDGSGPGQTLNHNLNAVPELIIWKSRSNGVNNWYVYNANTGVNFYVELNLTAAKSAFSLTGGRTPTSSVFYTCLSGDTSNNGSGITYVAYLFATCAGVSKVGGYTGTGAAQTIDCGFTAGSRFVMIKRTDSTGDWYVWDSARGIIPSNDPYLLINSTAVEVTGTDYVDTTNVGFDITSTAPAAINANGGTFIFLAIA